MIFVMSPNSQLLTTLRWAGFCADLGDSLVNDVLDLARIAVGVTRLDLLNRAMKHTPNEGPPDEFRSVTFFMPLAPKNVRRVTLVAMDSKLLPACDNLDLS